MYSRCISQFLDEYSNLKAECKKDVVHDAFDAIYVSYIDNRSRDFSICNFFHLRLVMVDIVRSLPPEPAVLCAHALHERRWVHGATVKGSFSRWCLGLSVVAYSRSSAARLSVI